MSTIVTFYSYKGGVGRSMALANVAVLLARRGLRVLTVDWDLEAPGIENYFSSFRIEEERPGLLTMLMDVAKGGDVDYRHYLWSVHDSDSTLSLLSSGKTTDPLYSANLERFDWEAFFVGGGGNFLERLRNRWRESFDFILIDSRTGLSDSGGICTIQLPDVVVAMFTANHQSLYGARDVMRLAQEARQSLAHDRPQLSIIPVASRFGSDFQESRKWLDRTVEAMSEFYRDWLPAWSEARDVVDQLKIPHIDYFGYGEKLAVVEQGTTDPQGMGFAYEKIADLLASDLANAEVVFHLRQTRQKQKAATPRETTRRTEKAEGYEHDLYVSFDRSLFVDEWLRLFLDVLGQCTNLTVPRKLDVFQDYQVLQFESSFPETVARALSRSRLLLAVITPRYFSSPNAVAEWKTFEKREELLASRPSLILPVVFRGPGRNAPSWFRQRVFYDMRETTLGTFDKLPAILARDIEKLSLEIVRRLDLTPPFSADFPVVSPKDVDVESPPPVVAFGP